MGITWSARQENPGTPLIHAGVTPRQSAHVDSRIGDRAATVQVVEVPITTSSYVLLPKPGLYGNARPNVREPPHGA